MCPQDTSGVSVPQPGSGLPYGDTDKSSYSTSKFQDAHN